MKKRAGSVLVLAAMAAMLSAGCSGSQDTDRTAEHIPAEAEKAEEGGEIPEENIPAAESTEVSEESVSAGTEEKFYIYSWDGELGERLEYIYRVNPEMKDRIEYVNVGSPGVYQEEVDRLLQNLGAEDYPDMIAFGADFIMKYTNSDFTIPVTDCGLTEVELMEMYPYTITIAADRRDYKLKGVSWQSCPGFFMYRADLAEAVLGVKSPEEMQERIGSWDGFLETAREIKEKSDDATRMLSSVCDVVPAFMSGRDSPWVDSDGVFRMDETMLVYMDTVYALENEQLTLESGPEGQGKGISEDSVFGFFGSVGDLDWTGWSYDGSETAGGGKDGLWNICQGPVPYFQGGTWLGATAGCSDTALAGQIMKALCCDTGVMTEISKGTGDYVNNKAAMKALSGAGEGVCGFLGGQNFIEAVFPVAEAADTSWMCTYDGEINGLLDEQVTAYIKGEKDKEKAVADFKRAVAETYPSLTVE